MSLFDDAAPAMTSNARRLGQTSVTPFGGSDHGHWAPVTVSFG